MARTLVISDLHLGGYAGHSVLERPGPRDELLGRLAAFDRLVLLGDALELGEGRPTAEVMQVAAPILAGLGASVPEIVLVPGNHDRLLIRPWVFDQGEDLAVEGTVPLDASALLSEASERLGSGGATVSVHYPGFSLSERVWMTHGHYLDRLLAPEGPYGMFRRPARLTPAAYESRQVHQHRPSGLRLIHRLLTPNLARITTAALDLQMRRHSLPALASALEALGVRSEYVIFGHVHRLGPLPHDRARDWEHPLSPGAAPTRFLNTGSWQHEPLLTGRRRPHYAYWPGGSVMIEDDGIPRAVGLLDRLDFCAKSARRPMRSARTR